MADADETVVTKPTIRASGKVCLCDHLDRGRYFQP
jgi:hypothetical protein